MDWIDSIAKKYALWVFIGTGLILYSYSLGNGFVGDDFDQLVNNTFIHSLTNLPSFFLGGTFNNGFVSLSGIYYKPVMTIMFSLLYTLFQATPFFYHLTQLLFHITNTILLFYLFQKFFPRTPAFIAAMIFLIHPINTEAVAYVSNLQDVLFTFFGLSGLTIIMYKPPSTKYILIAYLLFLLALLSKETGIVFIAVALLYQILYSPKDGKNNDSKNVILNWFQDPMRFRNEFGMTVIYRNVILAGVTVSIYAALRIHAVGLYKYQAENFPMMQLSFSERLLNIPQILFYYLKTFLFPVHLAFAQNWTVKDVTLTSFYLPLITMVFVVATIISLGVTLRNDKEKLKTFYFFVTLLILGLSLHLQILPLDMTVADRWFYTPFIGVLGLLLLAGTKFSRRILPVPVLQYGLSGIFVVLFCLTFARSLNWQSQYTLYGHDVKYNPSSYNLLNGWASELMNVGKYKEAEPFIRKSIALEPDFCYSWNNLGSVYAIRKDYKKARKYYETALKRRPCALAYNNLATLMYYHFDTDEAYTYMVNALQEVPTSPRLWLMYALVQHKKGDNEAALQAAKRSYQLSPSSAAAYVYTNLKNNQPFELKEN